MVWSENIERIVALINCALNQKYEIKLAYDEKYNIIWWRIVNETGNQFISGWVDKQHSNSLMYNFSYTLFDAAAKMAFDPVITQFIAENSWLKHFTGSPSYEEIKLTLAAEGILV